MAVLNTVLYLTKVVMIISFTFLKEKEPDSCEGRCNSFVDRTKSCQCNAQCTSFKDCCSDYETVCKVDKVTNPDNTENNCTALAQMTQQLWDNDVNRLSTSDMVVNFQGQVPDHTKVDNATQKFFSFVNETKLQGETFTTFLSLLDNYDPTKGIRENKTVEEVDEENAFLDAIFGTQVMDILLDYLTCRGVVKNSTELRSSLIRIWFDFYPRSGKSSIPDTSGFEHVMVGEYKTIAKVNGFHNWLSFYEKEKAGDLDYYGYVSKAEPNIIGAAFKWDNRMKPLGSFFYGMSPEFEFAIYSLCFLLHHGGTCKTVINGTDVDVRSYNKDGHIATIFLVV